VGCVNGIAEALARKADGTFGVPVYAFPHPYGCSQLGEDHHSTQKVLARLARHPNAGGVLVLGLGCENNHIAAFREVLGEVDERRARFLNAQDAEDEVEEGLRLIREIAEAMREDVRTEQDLSKLVIGFKCGGSDGLSGITANPLLGALSDGVCAAGGSALLTEVPEMFGAETILMDRCESEALFQDTVEMINGFKRYFESYGQPVYENPSPGNVAGGITTLEEKSLGCTQKGGCGPVSDVLGYAEARRKPGLTLLYAPGNDLVAATALTAAGAQMILFTTGRGTPFGAPVPTVKIATNASLASRKKNWIDFDASPLAEGAPLKREAKRLLRLVLDVASGAPALNEVRGERQIAIFKNGVTL
jgi:altronate hydrolase